MDAPPQPVPEAVQGVPSAVTVDADKAFVFGSTMASRPRAQVDVTVSNAFRISIESKSSYMQFFDITIDTNSTIFLVLRCIGGCGHPTF